MPRLLLIAYHYPPRPSAGWIRPAALAKYLPACGWDVTVLTTALGQGPRPAGRIIETEYRSVIAQWKSRLGLHPERGLHAQMGLSLPSQPNSRRLHNKIIDYAYDFIAFPDEYKGWVPFAEKALSRLPRELHPDVIVSTAPPPCTHLIAAAAKRRFGCPWVADFRDLWAGNLAAKHHLTLPLHARLEKKTLATADALVCVSAPWTRSLQQSYPDKIVYTVSNGFDPADFDFPNRKLTSYFSITYTGYLYEGKRDPSALFAVVRDLIAEGVLTRDKIRLRFYGQPASWMPPLVKHYGISDIVEIHGRIPRQEALQRQAESQILLLLGWADPRETGQHTGKLFEYLGSARPILAVGGARGVLSETLEETQAGKHVQSPQELRQFLLAAYREFDASGAVSYHPNQHAVSQYSHLQMADKFSQLLTATLSGRPAADVLPDSVGNELPGNGAQESQESVPAAER